MSALARRNYGLATIALLVACGNAPGAPQPSNMSVGGADRSASAAGGLSGATTGTAGAATGATGTTSDRGTTTNPTTGGHAGIGGATVEPEPEPGDPSFHDLAPSATT